MEHHTIPTVSVLIVSDYDNDHGSQKTWAQERQLLAALANQDYQEPFEVILMENEAFRNNIPSDLKSLLPHLNVHFSSATQSAELKDEGVDLTSGNYVAVFEADCVPNNEWLRVMIDVFRTHSQVSAVSGRTIYGTRTMWQRCLSLLDRGYMDLGHAGRIHQISNNSALFRRELLEKFPYPKSGSPFISAFLRLQAINHSDQVLFFEPRAVVFHAFSLSLENDLRKNRGFMQMTLAPTQQVSTILKIAIKNFWSEVGTCKRLGRTYLRLFDWPITFLLLLGLRFLEIPGMIDALRKKQVVTGTAYR